MVFLREEEAAADGAVVGEVGAGAADEDGDEVRERVGFDDGVVVEDPDVVAVVLLHRVAQGDVVAAGDTVCLIEAMKTFNPVKAHKGGRVTKILVESGDPVEYGAPLVVIE